MDLQSLTEKRDKFISRGKIIALVVVGFLLGPIIMGVIGGLVGLLVAAGVAVTAIQLAPVFSLKLANWKYRLIEQENVAHIQKVEASAAENPIETLTNILANNKIAFEKFVVNVEQSVAARDTFRDKVKSFAQKYPEKAADFNQQLARMANLVDQKKQALNEAQQSLEDGYHKLDEMKAYWEMSKTAIELNKAAGMDTGDVFEQLKTDTAFDAVFKSVNTAFAQLEVASSLSISDKPQESSAIAFQEAETLDANVVEFNKSKVTR